MAITIITRPRTKRSAWRQGSGRCCSVVRAGARSKCAGDAVVLPVATGHRRLEVSDDFMVVGAYPQGQDWDICREAPSDEARQRMRALPVPAEDPILGKDGPLRQSWKA